MAESTITFERAEKERVTEVLESRAEVALRVPKTAERADGGRPRVGETSRWRAERGEPRHEYHSG